MNEWNGIKSKLFIDLHSCTFACLHCSHLRHRTGISFPLSCFTDKCLCQWGLCTAAFKPRKQWGQKVDHIHILCNAYSCNCNLYSNWQYHLKPYLQLSLTQWPSGPSNNLQNFALNWCWNIWLINAPHVFFTCNQIFDDKSNIYFIRLIGERRHWWCKWPIFSIPAIYLMYTQKKREKLNNLQYHSMYLCIHHHLWFCHGPHVSVLRFSQGWKITEVWGLLRIVQD